MATYSLFCNTKIDTLAMEFYSDCVLCNEWLGWYWP